VNDRLLYSTNFSVLDKKLSIAFYVDVGSFCQYNEPPNAFGHFLFQFRLAIGFWPTLLLRHYVSAHQTGIGNISAPSGRI
jgi:hypothetical protein